MKTLTTKIPKDWEIKKLKDVLSFEQPGNYIVESTAYTPTGKTPVLTANKSFILGYTDEDFGIYTKTPAIIFDDFTTDSKFVDFDFKIKSSAIKILKTIDTSADLKFVYEMMKSSNFQVENHKRHYISQYQEQDIVIPLLVEQKKITEILSTVDNEIDKIYKLVSETVKLKNGLMNNFFTKGIEHKKFKKTKIGMAPYEWNECMLGDLIEIRSGESPSGFNFTTEGHPFFKVNDMNYSSKYMLNSELLFLKYKKNLMPKGMVVFPKRGASIFLNKVRILGCDSYFDTNVMGLISKKEIYNEFLYYFIDFVGLSKLADTTSIPQINNKHILPLNINLPNLSEQKKIAEILITIDKKISISNELKNKLIELKKGLTSDLLSGKVRVKNI